jgi:biuret amidohydrolase
MILTRLLWKSGNTLKPRMITENTSSLPLVDAWQLPAMIAPVRTALLIVDVQVDFVSPRGAAAAWGVDLGRFEAPLEQIERLLVAARNAGVTVAFARVVTRPETDSDALKNLHHRMGHPADALAICRAGTKGADYHRVTPRGGEIEIEKVLYSSFVGTNLDALLRARGIDTLVLAGFTTDCCVDCTARDAFHHDYNVFVVADACGAYEPELHQGTLNSLARNCALLADTQSVVSAWS